MDVRLGGDPVDALADDPDRGALDDRVAARDGRTAELQQRHRIPVRRLDRDRAAATGNGAGEGDGACDRREHLRADLGADVDAAVLSGGVRVRPEREGTQHRPVGRPRPGGGGRNREQERQDDRAGAESPHRAPPPLS